MGYSSDTELGQAIFPGERRLLQMVIPPWKTTSTWSRAKQITFIESIFLGFGCGEYICNGYDCDDAEQRMPASSWLLDGEQRILALREFVQNGLVIFDGSVSYADMDRRQKRQFGNESFPCYLLEYTDNLNLPMAKARGF